MELGLKLSTGLGRSVCSVAGFPASASTYNVVLFPKQCFSHLGVWCAGLGRRGLLIDPAQAETLACRTVPDLKQGKI